MTVNPTRFRDALDALVIPHPFTTAEMLTGIERTQGVRIELMPVVLGATAPCGLMVRTDEIVYICYAVNTTPLHQLHIVLHEIGHLLLGHNAVPEHRDRDPIAIAQSTADANPTGPEPGAGTCSSDRAALAALHDLCPDLSPELISRFLGRAAYDEPHEFEAEQFATLAAIRINSRAHAHGLRTHDATQKRMWDVFGASTAA